jgi:hypothetical protein
MLEFSAFGTMRLGESPKVLALAPVTETINNQN